MLKLNIGSGGANIPGFQNIDRKLGIEAFPLSMYPDGCVEEIRASHILEHFSFVDVEKALAEWVRVLKPGGRIRIAVPDIQKAVHLEGQEKAFVLMGGQMDDDDFHRSAFDEPLLRRYMAKFGIGNIQKWESDGLDTSSHPCSLNLEGVKLDASAHQDIKIQAVMSIPRVGWNDNWGCIHDALRHFGIPVARFNGVFWGQCMQRAFNEALDKGIDWLLTIDFDSMFTAQHVDKLLSWMGQKPEIDALFPLQMRRGHETALVTKKGQTSLEWDGTPVQVDTGHFGLTLIRMDALRKVQKPWFISKPSDAGEWDDDKIDDDIWFWHQWKQAGNTVYMAPDVSIGHLELMVSDFDDKGEPRHIYVPEWREEQMAK